MVRTVNKTLSLPLPLVEQLEDEENQSEVVANLLEQKYGEIEA